MPVAEFVTVVKCVGSENQQKAVAEAGRYLGYGDTTNAFGERGAIRDTETFLDEGNYHATIEWETPVAREEDIEQINREMDRLAYVTDHECVSNPISIGDVPQ